MLSFTYLPYAVVEAYCILYALTILTHLNSSIGSEHEVKLLKRMVFSYLGMLSTDILWALMEDNILRLSPLLNAMINCITIFSISLGCYYWYRFIDDRLQPAYAYKKHYDLLITIPIVFVFILDFISIFTGWLFYINSNNHYESTNLFDIQSFVNYFYLTVPTVNSVIHACKTHAKQQRSEYITYSIYMIAPLSAFFLEELLPTVPVLSLNVFLVVHLLFMTIQNLQIYNDALTDLNNRRRLNQYLEESLSRASLIRPVTLFMMDINCFKSINDQFGHIEGDHALKTFTRILKIIGEKYHAFIARYGGDEFCMVVDSPAFQPEYIEADIHEMLKNSQADNEKYVLTISIGYCISNHSGCEPDSFLAKADSILYKSKKEWHQEHPSATRA